MSFPNLNPKAVFPNRPHSYIINAPNALVLTEYPKSIEGKYKFPAIFCKNHLGNDPLGKNLKSVQLNAERTMGFLRKSSDSCRCDRR